MSKYRGTSNVIMILILIVVFLSITRCENPMDEYTYTIDPQLTQDDDGYFHLKLDPNRWQSFSRFTGSIFQNGKPLDGVRVTWESDFYWVLNDTAGYVVDYAYTDDLTYVAIDTSYIYFGQEQFLVPIVNGVSLSNAEGEFNTIFAPVLSQRGDTVSVYVNVLNDVMSFDVVLD